MSLWDYPIRSDRTCDAAGAPGRNCVDLRDRMGSRPATDDLVCSYCGKPFGQPLGRTLVARQDQGAGEEVLEGASPVVDEGGQEAREEQQDRQDEPGEAHE